ncbi:hypothetical protein Mycsm_06249 [Mycobacterium sp. JS623]|uniref:PaaI family thioesterase n=1 Tax=Mycobacterium sp. JS623 TaxID=212767 RepID=UPI0002A5B834|nr:PaaI family thioesterase [Mycobacterium sp. JS623]AGB26402.1 hypothetical protein Mycsm_06249 [Mycobacterium sp. JS623]
MSHPLSTPLGRFGIVTAEEGPQRCVASIPAGAMANPLTGQPTVAAVAMLVDHVGGLINHHRRGGATKVLVADSDPVLNNSLGIVHGGVSAMALELVGSAAVNDGRGDQPLLTASLRVNFLRQFYSGPESRYEATALQVGRSSGVAEALAVDASGKPAIIARITAYLG